MSQYNRSNISALISQKLPEFVRQDHPNFVIFLEEYYKWLQSKDNAYFAPLKLEGLVNIDTTVDDFLDYFKTLFFDGFPENYKSAKGDQVDVPLILKKIRSFYQSKGTEASIKFLMTLLFDVYSEIYIPSEDIFKASGGRWNQPTVVRCLDGNPSVSRTLRNLPIEFYDTSNVKVGSARIKDLKQFTKSGYHILELDLSEITGTTSYPGTAKINRKDGTSVTVQLIPFVTSVTVSNSGSFYTLDDEVTITTATGYNGVGFKGSVESLTPTGGIRSVRLDDPGLFYYPLNSSYAHYTISVTSETGTGASGFEMTTGTKVKKPGFYENNDGQLSSTEKLQDNYRYQIHSYVVRTEATLSEYEKTLRNLTHPAGKLVLGDYFVYRTESLTASTGGYQLGVLSEPYLANYLPYTIAEVSDGATAQIGAFGVFPSDFDLRGINPSDLSGIGSLTQHLDFFPYGYDGSTGYTIPSGVTTGTVFGEGISSEWGTQNFNIFGGVGSTFEYFGKTGSDQYKGSSLPGWPSNDTVFWIVHPHPNTWHGNVPSGSTWGGIVLQDFIRTPYHITSPPAKGSSYGSQGTLGTSPSIPSGYGTGI